jgi:GMP synthase-like glutamine amidotransferase
VAPRRPIAVLHHLERPFLGHAGPPLAAAGLPLDEHLPGAPLPSVDAVAGIVSLGGEASVRDIAGDRELAAEAELLRAAIAAGVPVLGVCLGAQLLAHALGGRVERLPRRLVAWPELAPLPAAAGDPVLGALPPGAAGLHWNEDGFEPPPGAVELLRRPSGGLAEAFRAGERAWGVQFHCEVGEPALEHWYADWQPALAQAGVAEATARSADAAHLGGQAELAEAVFGGFGRVSAGLAG